MGDKICFRKWRNEKRQDVHVYVRRDSTPLAVIDSEKITPKAFRSHEPSISQVLILYACLGLYRRLLYLQDASFMHL